MITDMVTACWTNFATKTITKDRKREDPKGGQGQGQRQGQRQGQGQRDNVSVIRSAECWTDHKLFRAKLLLDVS